MCVRMHYLFWFVNNRERGSDQIIEIIVHNQRPKWTLLLKGITSQFSSYLNANEFIYLIYFFGWVKITQVSVSSPMLSRTKIIFSCMSLYFIFLNVQLFRLFLITELRFPLKYAFNNFFNSF